MSDQRRSQGVLAWVTAGAVIGVVEVVLAASFAALVYGGYLAGFLADGIGLFLVAATITLAILALTSGRRGPVGSVQDAAAAVLSVVATTTALDTFGSLDRAFLSVVAATMVVTLLTGITFLVLGWFRLGNLIRFVPLPVVGGFLAGTGWLLTKGGLGVAGAMIPHVHTIKQFTSGFELMRWLPALAIGVALLVGIRIVGRPLVIPAVLGIALLGFAIGMLLTGSTIQDAKDGVWLLGPFSGTRLLQPWSVHALTGADWSAVLDQSAGIATAVFVAVIACLFNVSGVELTLHVDLDTNQELRGAGILNVVSGAFGGIPGYHALSLTSLARQMGVDARAAGLVAAAVPLAAVLFGASVVELIPRMIVGGVLVFVGLAFMTEWLIDARKTLPLTEYLIVIGILLTIATRGMLPGVVVGLVLAVVLFAVNYSRIQLVHEVEFGGTFRSNVDRPPGDRVALRELGDRVQILRVNGFVFFGTANGLLERIRKRVEAGSLRFLVVDLRRVTGMDSSAVLSFRKVAQLAEASGFELVFAGAPGLVERQLQRGGVGASDGVVRFEPDLDHGLQRCEDGLLDGADRPVTVDGSGDAHAGMPRGLSTYLERVSLPAGTVLIHQGDEPDDMYVLESGRLLVELATPEGTRMRLRTMLPGVVVGEVGLYMGVPRTADVVTESESVVLRLSGESIRRMEAENPLLAAELHRWLATTLAERLTDALRGFEALLD